MFYLTGDTHGQVDINKITMKKWPKQSELTREDYLIVLGDFGLYWKNDKTYEYLRDFYHGRKYTVLWVDGNHENFDWIDSLPVEEWNGGLVNRDDNIIHLRRGYVYDIDNMKFFTLGGAKSIDKIYRTEGISWWKQEEIDFHEQEFALKNLESSNWSVDYILTHAAPRSILMPMFNRPEYTGSSTTEKFLEYVTFDVHFKHWYFGHYHQDRDYGRYHCLYNRVVGLS